MNARPLIDSVNFARNAQVLSGEVAVKSLLRLQDSLTSSDGVLAYSLNGRHENDEHFLQLSISGSLYLCCQRCLGELVCPLAIQLSLPLLSAEKLAEIAEDELEDALEASAELDVLALVEDEILLALPFAPKHSATACNPAMESLKQSASPFAALAILKKQ